MSLGQKEKITCEIISHIGTVSESSKGWNLELNLVSWGGNEPKYDLRKWSPDHSKMGKGVALSEEELRSLYKIMENEIDDLDNN